MIYFLEQCEATIRTLPILQHDEHDSEDVDTDSEDHAGDETRYAVMSRPFLQNGELKADKPILLPGQIPMSKLTENHFRKAREAREGMR